MEPLDHDTAYKEIYGHRHMVEELARWLMPALDGGGELFDALDFDSLARVPEQSVAGGRRRSSDMAWRVRLRDRAAVDPQSWVHLVFRFRINVTVAISRLRSSPIRQARMCRS